LAPETIDLEFGKSTRLLRTKKEGCETSYVEHVVPYDFYFDLGEWVLETFGPRWVGKSTIRTFQEEATGKGNSNLFHGKRLCLNATVLAKMHFSEPPEPDPLPTFRHQRPSRDSLAVARRLSDELRDPTSGGNLTMHQYHQYIVNASSNLEIVQLMTESNASTLTFLENMMAKVLDVSKEREDKSAATSNKLTDALLKQLDVSNSVVLEKLDGLEQLRASNAVIEGKLDGLKEQVDGLRVEVQTDMKSNQELLRKAHEMYFSQL
jgi:hypothetical protein